MPDCTDVVHIRRARTADARAIAAVHVETWREAYRDLLPHDLLAALSVERRTRFWRSELEKTPAERMPWLAESEGEVRGFVNSGSSRDADATPATGEVYAIYVLPDCWDKGLGRELLSHAERDLREHGYTEAFLWVLAGNLRARRFYERSGWAVDATRTEAFGDVQLDEVRYRKRLVTSPVA